MKAAMPLNACVDELNLRRTRVRATFDQCFAREQQS